MARVPGLVGSTAICSSDRTIQVRHFFCAERSVEPRMMPS
jgi:hypothetical protein